MKWWIALASVGLAIYALIDAYQSTKQPSASAGPLAPTGGASS